jgi:X-X-X-Leu-X-X-Gly heptad repeat protein
VQTKLVTALLLTGMCALAEPFTINVYTTLAPSAYGSPSYGAWAANGIYALENGLPAFGTPGTPAYFYETPSAEAQNLTLTSFPSWMGTADSGSALGPAYANELGNQGAFPLFIDGNGGQFSISELAFTASSTDPGNALGVSNGAGSYNYGSQYVGGIENADGSITYVTSGPSTQLVNLLWGTGSGNALAPCGPGDASPCGSTAEQQADIDATAASLIGQTFTGVYTLADGSGTLATGSATLDLTDPPSAAAVPETRTILLLAGGILLLAGYRRRRWA